MIVYLELFIDIDRGLDVTSFLFIVHVIAIAIAIAWSRRNS